MGKSIEDQSPTYNQMTFEDLLNVIFSPESEAGRSLSGSQAGAPIVPSGRDLVPVSRSARRESKKGKTTKDISGRKCTDSSKNAGRKSCSASKSHPQKLSELSLRLLSLSRFKGVSLHEQTNSQNDSLQANLLMQLPDGSMEYAATWKRQITPCGLAYWEHSASTHRKSGPDYTGWPTPQACEGPNMSTTRENGRQAARITPQTVVGLVGWVTPSTRDHKDSPGMSTTGINPNGSTRSRLDQLPRQVHGLSIESSTASTETRGVLDPAFSRWLMGFPAVWDEASPDSGDWQSVQEQIAMGG